jgi:hypothetical protein
MAHGGTITTTAVLLAVLLAGCSSGRAGKAEADPPEASASESSLTSAATAEPTEAPAEAIDPCSLMPRSVWHRLVDPDERRDARLVPSLESDFGPVARCRVVHGVNGATAASWGYWLRPLYLYDVADAYGGDLISGLPGAEAFGTHTLASTEGYARVDQSQGFTVSVSEAFSFSEKGRTSYRLIEKALRALIREMDDDMQAVATDLPDSCPPADSREIRSVIGEVSHARGGLDHDVLWCHYVNDVTGARVAADVAAESGPEFQFGYTWRRDNKTGAETWIDPPPGQFTIHYTGRDPVTLTYTSFLPSAQTTIRVTAENDHRRPAGEQRGAVDEAALKRWGKSFVAHWTRELK